MRVAPPTSLLLLFALGAIPAGCPSARGARAWAASVCTVLSLWCVEVGSLAVRAQSELDISKIDSTEFKEAFDEVRECR
jgi:hypothetical protein